MPESDRLQEIQQVPLNLEARLHTWLEEDISIISDDLLVIGSQVRTAYNGFIDLLCISSSGDLVIAELKRDLTPREVVAQALDYASWVEELSHEQVLEIGNKYLKEKHSLTLEEAFQRSFDIDFPSSLNESHSILIVASNFDGSSERIINYLSKSYGVGINAIAFQYFKQNELDEFLGRVFLIEPSVVEQSSQGKKGYKRKPNLTKESLRELAKEKGLGEIYESLIRGLQGSIFKKVTTTLSSLVFVGDYSKSNNAAIFSLAVADSNSEEGLIFKSFTMRFSEHLEVGEDKITSCYPLNYSDWQYNNKSNTPEWQGHTGHFKSMEDVQVFLSKLAEVKRDGSQHTQN